MLTKEAWKSSYDKWCKAEDKTRRKVKWNKINDYGNLSGWKKLRINYPCSYCEEYYGSLCAKCPLAKKDICSMMAIGHETFWKYVAEMNAKRTNWKRALELCTKIREAIEDDGREWGYICNDSDSITNPATMPKGGCCG